MKQTSKKKTKLIKIAPTFLTIVAILAIIWYICTDFSVTNNWWFLPLMAIITGVTTIALPIIAKRFKLFWSIVSTGITLLILQCFQEISFAGLVIALSVIALVTDLSVHGKSVMHIGETVFDVAISFGVALYLTYFSYSIVRTLFILIGFLLTLKIDFTFKFFLKGTNSNPTKEIE